MDAGGDGCGKELSGVSDTGIVDKGWHSKFRVAVLLEGDAGVNAVPGGLVESGVCGGRWG